MEYTRTDTKQQSRVIDTRQQSKQTPSIFELLQGNNSRTLQQGPVAQRMLYGDPQNAKELIEKQIELQKREPAGDAPVPSEGLPGVEASVPEDDDVEAEVTPGQIHDRLDNDLDRDGIKRPHNQDYFTTVGFEFEFAQFPNGGEGSILQNVLHTQLARSEQIFAYTGLPFFLETDAGSELELVTPPFVIETVEGTSIPLADDVEKADDLMETGITEVIGKKHEKVDLESAIRLPNMVGNFRDKMGLDFIFQSDDKFDEIGKITNHNMMDLPSDALYGQSENGTNEEVVLDPFDILGGERQRERFHIKRQGKLVMPSHKLDGLSQAVPVGENGIGTQINIAMEAEAYQQMVGLPKPYQSYDLDVSGAKGFIEGEIVKGCKQCSNFLGGKFSFLAGEIAMYLVNTFALRGMDDYLTTSEKFWQRKKVEYRQQHPESSVKDLRGVWFKDSVRGLIDDVFDNRTLDYGSCKMELAGVLMSMKFDGFNKDIGRGWVLDQEKMIEAANVLAGYLQRRQEEESDEKPGVCERDKKYPSDVRPDTYVHLDPDKVAPGLEGRKMHLVESRYFSSLEVVYNLRRMACLQYLKLAKEKNDINYVKLAFGCLEDIEKKMREFIMKYNNEIMCINKERNRLSEKVRIELDALSKSEDQDLAVAQPIEKDADTPDQHLYNKISLIVDGEIHDFVEKMNAAKDKGMKDIPAIEVALNAASAVYDKYYDLFVEQLVASRRLR